MAAIPADAHFRGVGSTPGLHIWCVEDRRLIPIPKSSHGKFFSASSFIVLNTVLRKKGPPRHDLHFWLGKHANQADVELASHKALELDAVLGSCSVQYREIQGHETQKFLSYFKPCIIPIEGAFSNGLHRKTICLLRCKGEHAVSVTEVPFSRSSLNHNDVFIVDTEAKIYLFCGSNSSIQERAKALEVVQYVRDNNHGGRCEVSHIEDGKFVNDPNVGEFWALFGGYAPLGRSLPTKKQKRPKKSRKLYWINKGKICPLETTKLERSTLKSNWCYMLDCDEDIYVWMGRNTMVTERKKSISSIEALVQSQDRSVGTHIIILSEGSETAPFKLQFDEWSNAATSLYEDGREKVAAIFKHQGYEVKELPEDNYEPLIDCTGTLKVWQVDNGDVSLVPTAERGKLYSGNCYIVEYIYYSHDRVDYLFYAWVGHSCTLEDKFDAISQMSNMINSTKGHPVMAQIFEGKEPIQFFAIFKALIILKGGTSSRYKKFISERGCADETYNKDTTTLFRVQGSGRENMQAVQVDLVSSSLNSSSCYILQDATFIYAWAGNLSTTCDRDVLYGMLEIINEDPALYQVSSLDTLGLKWYQCFHSPSWKYFETRSYFRTLSSDAMCPPLLSTIDLLVPTENNLVVEHDMPHPLKPLKQPISMREGNEPDNFWKAIGKKMEYPKEKEIKGHVEDPHLFSCILKEGGIKWKEIYSFSQDDITTEEVLILDCCHEIYVWVGQHAGVTSKVEALNFGKKFLEADFLLEGLSLETAIYIVTEGFEPPFFTCFFDWDPSKVHINGNSFERKLAILKGLKPPIKAPSKALGQHSSEYSPIGGRKHCFDRMHMRSVSPTPNGQFDIKVSKNRHSVSPTLVRRELLSDASAHADNVPSTDSSIREDQHVQDTCSSPKAETVTTADEENVLQDKLKTFPYELLKVPLDVTVTGIDMTKRESYLSDKEFQEKFGMTKEAFYKLPLWKRNQMKIALKLF